MSTLPPHALAGTDRRAPPHPRSRRGAALLALAMAAGAAGLSGCASPPAPAPPLLHLGSAQPTAAAPGTPASAAPDVWQLTSPLRVPAAIDREAVMVSLEPGRLVPWHHLRWSESLRDTAPRLLAQDLAALRGTARLWPGSPPPGVQVDRLLRVDILAWDALAYEGRVRMVARWSLSDPRGRRDPVVHEQSLSQPWQPTSAPALVQAQRDLLQQLARAIAATPA